ncbi:hypothetical protein NEA10_06785 [Phormidium yuhuli AB48]|uniref:Antitoxin VbhA domain-containing protein n=1 Tax=Phormidium yuhuli AB48 TaxID=2940671 RepID=A0ABY5AWE3_9CYAN|nr:hypothetical protein [Phormidium yuhuli]USR92418.1 hypothetical protein NEA10_06785 [Phormidium yuhuli AB48]
MAVAGIPSAEAVNHNTSAFNLVQLARNGYLRDQGIPQFNQLAGDYRSGQITAEDLIRAAIAENRISPDVADDPGYLETVDHFLNDLDR